MTFHEIAMKGGTIIVNVHWNCFFWWLQDNQEFFSRNCDLTISFDPIVQRPNEMIGRLVHKPEYNRLGDKMTCTRCTEFASSSLSPVMSTSSA